MNPLYPKIPEITLHHKNPNELNVVQFWGFFSQEELSEKDDKFLMLDIDFGRKCSLRCPSCFRRNNPVDDVLLPDLKYNELLEAIEESQSIGLRQIKICGAGEPLENPLLLRFARDLTERGIGLSVFTKGHVLGDDAHVAKVYGEYGIINAQTLCEEFFELKTSFLVSFQSAYNEIQDNMVGGIIGYSYKRNRALELLTEAGFNQTVPTRLAMCTNPITKSNYHELFDIYVYARERNILPVIAALMVSSKQIDKSFLQANDVTNREKEDLFMQIYEYNLENGFHTKEQLFIEGISCMPGIHPCNQIAAGLYLTCNGNLLRCPGDNGQPLGNVHKKNIVEIWKDNNDWPYKGKYNCHCPYKDNVTLPHGIYDRVNERLLYDLQHVAV